MHTLEVLLQLRSSDLTWWNSNVSYHQRQLYKLIGRRILPSELGDEIQADAKREQGLKTVSGEIVKRKGIVIGEVNLKKMTTSKIKSKPTYGQQRGNQSMKAKVVVKKSKPVKQFNSKTDIEEPDAKDKRPKLLREAGKWIMGKSIQACYVMEDIDRTASCSMAFRPVKRVRTEQHVKQDNKSPMEETNCPKEEKLIPLATFRSWNKLSKRLNIWVFKFDPDDPTDLSVSEDGGFPRPDLLPLSDIFRPV